MNESSEFFQTSGTLAEDAPSYIERPADNDLFITLKGGELCLVLAPRQSGKSSLMVHTAARLRKEGIRPGIIDLQRPGAQKNPDRWFKAVIDQLTRFLKLKENSMEWWKRYAHLDASQRFSNFLEDVVLAEVQEPLVIFFDEIDTVLSLPFSDDFFTTIRSIYNERATNPTLKRLTFVLLGVATASSFIRDRTQRSPFNLGKSILLNDFEKESIESFRNVLGESSDQLIERIFYWTNGQPYLVQNLAAAAYSWELDERTPERLDQEVKSAYFQNLITRDHRHLQPIQNYLLAQYEISVRELLKTYYDVLDGESILYNEQSIVHNRLKLSGIVTVKDQQLTPRNRLYENIFNLQWVQKHFELPDQELALLSDAKRPAFVPGYTHDIFVSYAYIDDKPAPGMDEGWVTTFIKGLKDTLARRFGAEGIYKLWIDPELAKIVHITPKDISKDLNNTAVFVIILSRAYLESDWCRQWHKNRFLSMVQERLRSGLKICVVEIDRVEEDERLRELNDASIYRFWVAEHEKTHPRLLGMPHPSQAEPQYYDLLNQLSYDLSHELQRLKKEALLRMEIHVPNELWRSTPYPGLRPFNRDESDFFFGRETHIEQPLEKLSYGRFVALVGGSGCGKTSLVRAGLIPALERGDLPGAGNIWRIVEMQPGYNPFRHLAEALLENFALGQETLSDVDEILTFLQHGPQSLVELLQNASLQENTRFLVFIDQFEEIFFQDYQPKNQNEIKAFIALLLASVNQQDVPIYAVITMRSEFVSACARFPGLLEVMNPGQFLVPHLTCENLKKAIIEPTIKIGDKIETDLVNHLLEEMENDPAQFPFLQHCLMRMWHRATSRTKTEGITSDLSNTNGVAIMMQDYEAVGCLKNALSNHAEEVFQKLDHRQQRLVERLFRYLSDRRHTGRSTHASRPVRVSEVAAITHVSDADIIEAADVFRRPEYGFLTPNDDILLEPDSMLRVSYEGLFGAWSRLQTWVEQEAKSAETYQHLKQSARLWKQGKADLWGVLEVQDVQRWWNQESPNVEWASRYGKDFALADEFLRESTEKVKRQQEHERFKRSRLESENRQLEAQYDNLKTKYERECQQHEHECQQHEHERQQHEHECQQHEHECQQLKDTFEEHKRSYNELQQQRKREERFKRLILIVLILMSAVTGWYFFDKKDSTFAKTEEELTKTQANLTQILIVKESLEQEFSEYKQQIFWFDEGIIVENEGGEDIKSDDGIYSVKAGKAITITVEFTDPNNKVDDISWEADHGKIPPDSNNSLTNIYTPSKGQEKLDEIEVKLWDRHTGIELIKTIRFKID